MRRFTQLYERLDATRRTAEKVAALEAYFREAPARDAAWALYYLTGRRLKRAVPTTLLRTLVAEAVGHPDWLVEECYDAVGDLAETLALLLPEPATPRSWPLHELMEQRLLALREADEPVKREILRSTWHELTGAERFLWHKLITGGFRVGVARTLVVRALAGVAGISQPAMEQRVTGDLRPTEETFLSVMSPEGPRDDPARPYPFFLASPVSEDPTTLGDVACWQVEWKWDGIRAQLLRRQGLTAIWSRGEELVTDRFPEVQQAAERLPEGSVLDGEILAWKGDAPLPFGVLQKRIGRKRVGPKTLADAPVVFLAFDLLEIDGQDMRAAPLSERRAKLESLLEDGRALRLSPVLTAESWAELERLKNEARERGVEGLMLKRRDSPYRVGRVRGDWWKWKVDPHRIDAVLMYAQRGHGRRASLYTDYTFGVWSEGELTPVAKAYSGLSDEEIREVDAFVRRNVTGRFGPVRVVKPELVFELQFEGIRASGRHKSGVAVRFPRMARWRRDKDPAEADSLDTLKALLPAGERA